MLSPSHISFSVQCSKIFIIKNSGVALEDVDNHTNFQYSIPEYGKQEIYQDYLLVSPHIPQSRSFGLCSSKKITFE